MDSEEVIDRIRERCEIAEGFDEPTIHVFTSDLRRVLTEIERLRRIEAAAHAAHEAEKAWQRDGGMNPGLAGAMIDAQARLRDVMEGKL